MDEKWTRNFWKKVIQTEPEACWLWNGATVNGYGRCWWAGNIFPAHRIAYGLENIPSGLTLDHLCAVRNCVNPAHLEPVTLAENIARAKASQLYKIKTVCKHGHIFDEDNTYWYEGKRWCRACRYNRKGKQNGRSNYRQ